MNKKVLVVDDEPLLLAALDHIISSAGYDVITSMDGTGAFQKYSFAFNNPPSFDIVITDLTIPGISGIELIRQIVELDPFVPIIITTGQYDVLNIEMSSFAGSWEMLLKPFRKQDMLDAIERASLKKDAFRTEVHKRDVINSLIKFENQKKTAEKTDLEKNAGN